MAAFDRSHMISVSNYDHIVYRFRDKAVYWSKIAIVHIPGKRLQVVAVFFTTEPDG